MIHTETGITFEVYCRSILTIVLDFVEKLDRIDGIFIRGGFLGPAVRTEKHYWNSNFLGTDYLFFLWKSLFQLIDLSINDFTRSSSPRLKVR